MRRVTGPSARRLIDEAMAGVVQRSSHSVMTILGVALGVGSFVTVLGITASANGQFSTEFLKAEATQITVTADQSDAPRAFPAETEASLSKIVGVRDVGRWWTVDGVSVGSLPDSIVTPASQPALIAASPGYFRLVGAETSEGRTFDGALRNSPVAVVGEKIVESLNLAPISEEPVILINHVRVSVIGIVSDTEGSSAALTSVVIPDEFARDSFGEPGNRETVVIRADRGAARVVANQIPLAINPYDPSAYTVVPPPEPSIIRDRISGSSQNLFIALAAVCLLVSAVGIANISLLGVVARTREIALRRSLGARPRHIALQFLAESALRGTLGGFFGTTIAVCVIVAVAAIQQWTALIEPWSLVVGPVGGAVVGTAAGIYPAVRATRVEPVYAFRS